MITQDVVYDLQVMAPDQQLRITHPARPLGDEIEEKLREGLAACPDLAFAHLVDVDVPEQGEGPGMVLFVWLVPAAMKSMRAALNLVSETVAKALPRDHFLDVVILNSAPELLPDIERAGCLLTAPHPDERQRALAAVFDDDIRVPGP
jgi:hypothetical protein